MISHKVLKRFIKDYALPIQVVQAPYFDYFINLYHNQYNSKEKLQLLEHTLSCFNSEEEFLDEYYSIRDKIITSIEDTTAFKDYNSMNMNKFNVPNKSYPSRDIFKITNVGKYFVSIDLVKANFQALKYLNAEIVCNSDTYEELIEKFCDLEYLKNSKYLRQVIFGNMNPKRQIKIERYITEQILDFLLDSNIFTTEQIRMVANDEIVFEIDYTTNSKINSSELIKLIENNLNFNVDTEIYKLNNIKNSDKFFVKEFINREGYELMCIPLVYHAQLFKMYNNLEIAEEDLLFFYENQVCRFLYPLNLDNEGEKYEH